MKKRVYIVESHHHVIREWFRYSGRGMHLLSFDYHTDFREAFIGKSRDLSFPYRFSTERHKSYLSKHIPCTDVEAAIEDLRNDEHIDFAIRSGMIEKAFVFSCEMCGSNDRVVAIPVLEPEKAQAQIYDQVRKLGFDPECLKVTVYRDADASCDGNVATQVEKRIVSYSELHHPLLVGNNESQWAKDVMSDAVLNDVLSVFRGQGFDQRNYILDFDCDFIRDRDVMTHGRIRALKELIRDAKAITIARESGWVLKCSGGTLSCEEIEAWLLGLIQGCMDDVEIECESYEILT